MFIKICSFHWGKELYWVLRIMMSALWRNVTTQVFRKMEAVDFPETVCCHEPKVHNNNLHSKFILGKWFL